MSVKDLSRLKSKRQVDLIAIWSDKSCVRNSDGNVVGYMLDVQLDQSKIPDAKNLGFSIDDGSGSDKYGQVFYCLDQVNLMKSKGSCVDYKTIHGCAFRADLGTFKNQYGESHNLAILPRDARFGRTEASRLKMQEFASKHDVNGPACDFTVDDFMKQLTVSGLVKPEVNKSLDSKFRSGVSLIATWKESDVLRYPSGKIRGVYLDIQEDFRSKPVNTDRAVRPYIDTHIGKNGQKTHKVYYSKAQFDQILNAGQSAQYNDYYGCAFTGNVYSKNMDSKSCTVVLMPKSLKEAETVNDRNKLDEYNQVNRLSGPVKDFNNIEFKKHVDAVRWAYAVGFNKKNGLLPLDPRALDSYSDFKNVAKDHDCLIEIHANGEYKSTAVDSVLRSPKDAYDQVIQHSLLDWEKQGVHFAWQDYSGRQISNRVNDVAIAADRNKNQNFGPDDNLKYKYEYDVIIGGGVGEDIHRDSYANMVSHDLKLLAINEGGLHSISSDILADKQAFDEERKNHDDVFLVSPDDGWACMSMFNDNTVDQWFESANEFAKRGISLVWFDDQDSYFKQQISDFNQRYGNMIEKFKLSDSKDLGVGTYFTGFGNVVRNNGVNLDIEVEDEYCNSKA